MLVGGLWTVFKMRKTLLKGVTSGLQAYRSIDGGGQAAARSPARSGTCP